MYILAIGLHNKINNNVIECTCTCIYTCKCAYMYTSDNNRNRINNVFECIHICVHLW